MIEGKLSVTALSSGSNLSGIDILLFGGDC